MWGERGLPACASPRKRGPQAQGTPRPEQRDPRLRGGSHSRQAETLHPHVRPFGHRVTLTTAPRCKAQDRQCSARFPRETPGRMRALRRVWGPGQASCRWQTVCRKRKPDRVEPCPTPNPSREREGSETWRPCRLVAAGWACGASANQSPVAASQADRDQIHGRAMAPGRRMQTPSADKAKPCRPAGDCKEIQTAETR